MANLDHLIGLTSTSELSEAHIHSGCVCEGISRKDQLGRGSALKVGCTIPTAEGLDGIIGKRESQESVSASCSPGCALHCQDGLKLLDLRGGGTDSMTD